MGVMDTREKLSGHLVIDFKDIFIKEFFTLLVICTKGVLNCKRIKN